MELPKFTTPGSLAPSLSLADSVKNVTSQASNMSVPAVSGPNIQNLVGGASSKIQSSTGALGNLGSVVGGVAAGGVTGALIGKIGGGNVGTAALGGAVGGAAAKLAGGGIGSVLGASAAGGLASTAISKLGGGSLGSALGGSAVGALAGTALGNLSSAAGGAADALKGQAGDLTSAAGSATDALKGQMDSLQGAARAKLMASAPELPEQAKGMAGIMEKGVDLGKFQEKSVSNLMSKVSDFSPGKSIANLASEKDIAAGLKGKLDALKPSGALGNALSGALGGAGIGAAVGAITGGGGNLLQNAARGAGIGAAVGGITGAVSGLAGSSTNPISSAVSGITGAASNLAGSAKNAIGSALGGGSVANTVASGVTGAVGGTVLGKLAGGQSINLKNFAGNLGGSVGGALGGQIGANLVGSTVPSAGLGAGLGGAVAGLVGGSPAKKALTGLAAGIGLGAVTGVVTNRINSALGVEGSSQGSAPTVQAPTVQLPTVPGQIQNIQEIKPQQIKISDVSPVQSIGSFQTKEIPDVSKNPPKEIEKIEDKSPQSVPSAKPPPPPDSPPGPSLLQVQTGLIPSSEENVRQFAAQIQAGQTDVSNLETVNSVGPDLNFLGTGSRIFRTKYTRTFGTVDFEYCRGKLEEDIKKVTPADRARVKSMISSYPKNFSLGYMKFASDGKTYPERRTLGVDDFIAMDSEDFYKFLTSVPEGQFELADILSKNSLYKVFMNQKSPSEVTVTISHPAYGTATSILTRAIPPPINQLFDYKGMIKTLFAYYYGKPESAEETLKNQNVSDGYVWDATKPKEGAYLRMFSTWGPTGKANAFYCGNNIFIDQKNAGIATGEGIGKWTDLPGTTPEIAGIYSYIGIIRNPEVKDQFFRVHYHPYTMQIGIIEFVKLIPKT